MDTRNTRKLLQLSQLAAGVTGRETLLAMLHSNAGPLLDCLLVTLLLPGHAPQRYYLGDDALFKAAAAHRPAVPGGEDLSPFLRQARDRVRETGRLYGVLTRTLREDFPGDAEVERVGKLNAGCSLYCGLDYQGAFIGVAGYHFAQASLPAEEEAAFYQEASALLAATLHRILDDESRHEREQEKQQLLQLKNAIATTRSTEALQQALTTCLQPILRFAAPAPLYAYEPENNRLRQLGAYAGSARFLFPAGELVAELLAASGLRQLTWPEAPESQALGKGWQWLLPDRAGIRQTVALLLRVDGEPTGVWLLHYAEEFVLTSGQTDLLLAFAGQVSLAVSNIAAQDDLQARQREQTLQVQALKALTSSRKWEEAMGAFARVLEPVVPFDWLSVTMLTEADLEQSFGFIAESPGTDFTYYRVPDYLLKNKSDMGQLQAMLGASTALFEEPDYYTGERLEEITRRYEIVRTTRRNNPYASIMYIPIRYSEEKRLLLILSSRQPEAYHQGILDLLKRLVPEISLAVENLVAFQLLDRQEKEKSLEIILRTLWERPAGLTEKLADSLPPLQKVLPFDYISFFLQTSQGSGDYSFERIGSAEYRLIDPAAFRRVSGLTQPDYEQIRQDIQYPQAVLFNDLNFLESCRQCRFHAVLARTFGLKSAVFLPAAESGKGKLWLSLFTRRERTYHQEHLQQAGRILPVLAALVEKLLIYEEIQALNEKLQREKTYLQQEVNTQYNFGEIVGTSPVLRAVFEKVSLVAPTDTTILLLGETGTGKELFARAIHDLSPRKDRVLVKVNCAALPAQLIESELFGHEKGAFTGAIERRTGKFELAQGGTIFLDEIGELPLELQAKLLRVIQEKEFERLGSNKVIKTDARIIAATNRNLEKEVAAGRFRSDLYFRLSVFPVTLPPLRTRKEDIPQLASYFLQKMAKKLGKNIKGISPAALEEMRSYAWPGNVRELEHVLERASILAGDVVEELSLVRRGDAQPESPDAYFQLKTLAENERELILNTLRYTNGRIRGPRGAARILDIEPNTLDARMRKLGIVRKHILEEE